MPESIVYNEDCLTAMKKMPDKAFDLAVVDPPYGGGSQKSYVERERERERGGLHGGAADWEQKPRSRFGGWFAKYHIGDAGGRNVDDEVSRGYL